MVERNAGPLTAGTSHQAKAALNCKRNACSLTTHVYPSRPQSGASIDQIQRSSGARVQLSRSGEFYPGARSNDHNGPLCCLAASLGRLMFRAVTHRRKKQHTCLNVAFIPRRSAIVVISCEMHVNDAHPHSARRHHGARAAGVRLSARRAHRHFPNAGEMRRRPRRARPQGEPAASGEPAAGGRPHRRVGAGRAFHYTLQFTCIMFVLCA